jgi:hypothetical protein
LFFGKGKSTPVTRAEELRDLLPPDKQHHYRDGYSMAEAAKLWVSATGRVPPKIADIIGSDKLDSAHFEYLVYVWGGGMSMTDIMAFVPCGVIAVEAKAREGLGPLVFDWIVEKAAVNSASPPHRQSVVDRYAAGLGVSSKELMSCRYQLLHRTLSAALTAENAGASRAWMIVESFAPPGSIEHRCNLADFNRFIDLVGVQPRLAGRQVTIDWVQEL